MYLSLQPNWIIILCSILVLTLGGFLCWRAVRRLPRKMTRLLECLRFTILSLICFLLFKPEVIRTQSPTQSPQIAILYDGSDSMQTLDAILANKEAGTRAQLVQQLSESAFIKDISSINLVSITAFSEATQKTDNETTGAATQADDFVPLNTDIATPLDSLLKSSDNLRAVIIMTDGGHNAATSPLSVAMRFKQRGIPLFPIPIGSTEPLPDIELMDVSPPSFAVVTETVKIPYTIRSTIGRETAVLVTLKSLKTGETRQESINLPATGELARHFLWKVTEEGADELQLSLQPLPQETITSNNDTKFQITGKKEHIKVLVIDSLPRWEYRFIRNALYRDPAVEVHTLLLHPNLDIIGEGPGYLTSFPQDPKELQTYDVIFIGDVGLDGKGLTREQATQIKGLVEQQATGVVFLPGYQGRQLELLKSDLGDLFPVTFQINQPNGFSQPEPSPLSLTSEGQSSLLTLLADSTQENTTLWSVLPGFTWCAPVERAKAGASVLAVHSSKTNKYGRLPLLVAMPVAKGKVLFMGTDSAWKWRKGVEDKYHYRFWRQVARWMSYQRNMATGENIRLLATPERPRLGDTITFSVLAADAQGAPLQNGEVFLDIKSPHGTTKRVQLQPQDGTWGGYTTTYKFNQPGTWKITANTTATPDKTAELTLQTREEPIEKLGLPTNRVLLQEIAGLTHGMVIEPADVDTLAREIRALPTPPPIETRILLWSNPYIIGGIIALLALFWIGRKLNGTF